MGDLFLNNQTTKLINMQIRAPLFCINAVAKGECVFSDLYGPLVTKRVFGGAGGDNVVLFF